MGDGAQISWMLFPFLYNLELEENIELVTHCQALGYAVTSTMPTH